MSKKSLASLFEVKSVSSQPMNKDLAGMLTTEDLFNTPSDNLHQFKPTNPFASDQIYSDYARADAPCSDSQLNSLEEALTQSNALLRSELNNLSDALIYAREKERADAVSKNNLKQKLTSLLSHLPVGVIELCPDGFVVDANPAAVSILDSSLVGLRWSDVLQQTFRPQPDDGFEVSLVNGRRVQVQTQSMSSRSGQIILLNDQTQTRQLQNELARSARMAALGKTAATLAHQVRTPLCGALLYLSEVIHDPQLPTEFVNRLEKAKGRLIHLERQVQQILMLSRGEVALSERLTLPQFWQGVQQGCVFLQKHFGGLSVEEAPDESQWLLPCNPEALVGAILNLVENAIQACEDKGQVSVTMALEHRDSNACSNTLKIVVKDTGVGMSEDVKKQFLDPFYTQREGGTGLGTSVVKLVVDAHQGDFHCQSALGLGTEISIDLPIQNNHRIKTEYQ